MAYKDEPQAGTAANPYLIATAAEWELFIADINGDEAGTAFRNKYYQVTADLDFAAIAAVTMPTRWFTGNMNGNRKTLRNIVMATTPSAVNEMGLFSYSSGAIYDLYVDNIVLVGSSPNEGQSYCGAIVGQHAYGGTVTRCKATGVSITHAHTQADLYQITGLLVGANHGAVVDCEAEGSIWFSAAAGTYSAIGGIVGHQTGGASASQAGYVSGCTSVVSIACNSAIATACYVGGIVGQLIPSSGNVNYVTQSHSTVDFDLTNTTTDKFFSVGGVVGRSTATISKCSARGRIKANSAANIAAVGRFYVGGILAQAGDANNILSESCAKDIEIIVGYDDAAYVGGGVGLAHGAIADCYAIASFFDMTAGSTTLGFFKKGGFASLDSGGTQTNCFAVSGACVGLSGCSTNGTLTRCFWDTSTSKIATSGTGATGKTTAELKSISTFADFNVYTIWTVAQGQYPTLKAEPAIDRLSAIGGGLDRIYR